MASTKELLAQLTTQIAAALIVRSTGAPALPESLVMKSMDIAKEILEEAEKRFPKGQSFFG
jgi:hypothetical protein